MTANNAFVLFVAFLLAPLIAAEAQQGGEVEQLQAASSHFAHFNFAAMNPQLANGSNSASASNPLRIPARSKQAIPDLMDLSTYYTSSLEEGHLSSLPDGVHAYQRAAFDIRGVIQLAGSGQPTNPNAVRGIAIHRKGETIDFLQGASGHAAEDTAIGNYVLHYANGDTRKIPLIYGRNIRDSFKEEAQANAGDVLTDAATAWSDGPVRVFKYTVNNPLPSVEIETMDFVSNATQAAPFLIAMTVEPAQADRTYEWFDSIRAWNPIAPRDPLASPDQVDLTNFYGTSLNDDWFDHAGHDLQDVPQGLKLFGGTLFDVRGLIVLAGTNSLSVSGLALPEAVKGIPVGRKGKALHFLQASAFVGTARGLKIGEYVMHYANGETRTADLIYGENELDWWVNPAEGQVTKADEVWFGSDPATRSRGMKTRLIEYTWKNPLPDVTITSIDFVSCLTSSSPMLVAMTVEPAGR
ncbi:MAG TPA: hypothetical protein VF392_10580 [Terracidiphilus sp.]